MKIVMLSVYDFACSGWRIAQAINKYTNHEVKLVKLKRYEFGMPVCADMVLDSESGDARIAQQWINEADIVHFKGDEPPELNWFGLKIPGHKNIIVTVGGSSFRRDLKTGKRTVFSLGSHEFHKYNLAPVRTTITPELNYPEFHGQYTPHAIDSTSKPNLWVKRSNPVIAHSPSARDKKGTGSIFIPAMEILKQKGYSFEVDIIEKVSNDVCVERKKNATIFYDQCFTGFYGMSALEAMQYGVPVVARVDSDAFVYSDYKIKPSDLPVFNVEDNIDSMVEVFESILISLKGPGKEMKEVSEMTKLWVDRFHSYEVVARQWDTIYHSFDSNYVHVQEPELVPYVKQEKSIDTETPGFFKNFYNVAKKLLSNKELMAKIGDPEGISFADKLEDKVLIVAKPLSDNFIHPYHENMGECSELLVSSDFNKIKDRLGKNKGIVWIEWGSNFAMQLLREPIPGKVIVRVHDWEVSSGFVKSVNWSNVSVIWFINKNTRRDFYELLPNYRDKPSFYLPNAVDDRDFTMSSAKGYGKNIIALSVSYKERKGYLRLLDFMSELLKVDSEWRLTIKAGVTSEDERFHYDNVIDKIHSLGISYAVYLNTTAPDLKKLKNKKEVVELFSDKDIIISMSNHEAFHYAIAEGMLCGLKPIVFDWEWGRPRDFWEPFVFTNYNDIIRDLLEWSKLDPLKKMIKSQYFRDYVQENFSPKVLVTKLKKKIFTNKTLVFCAHNHPVKFSPRGAEKSMEVIINHFRGLGYNVVVVVRNTKNKINEQVVINEITYISVATTTKTEEDYFRKVKEVLSKVKPDVVLSYALATPSSSKVCIELGIPYIVLVRWWRLMQPLPPGRLLERDIDYEFVNNHKFIFDNAVSIITNNRYATKVIERFYGVKSTYSLVPVYPDKRRHTVGNIGGYVTLVSPVKDLGEEELIKTLAYRLPNQKFLMVNVGNANFSGYTNIEVCDYVSDMDVVYKKTKILLYCAYNNDVCGTSRVAAEAMSYGIPVISNDSSGLGELIPNLVSRDAGVEEWVEKITYISENYEEFNKAALEIFDNYDTPGQLDVFVEEVEKIIFK